MSDHAATGQPAAITRDPHAAHEPASRQVDSSQVEWFQMLAWRWNITVAKQLAQGREPQGRLDPGAWKGMLGLLAINIEHAARVDLSEPLIVVPVPNGGMLIIDGWHRLYKALDTGVAELYAVVLTAEEELACRIFGGESGDEQGVYGDDEECGAS